MITSCLQFVTARSGLYFDVCGRTFCQFRLTGNSELKIVIMKSNKAFWDEGLASAFGLHSSTFVEIIAGSL